MYTLKEYVKPDSISQAYELLMQSKNNCIIGGNMFLRLGKKRINKGIDLSLLNLNKIEETDDSVEIGASVSLSEIENSDIIRNNFGTSFATCINPIIGVAFKNTATIGGSVYGSFGFSDIMTYLLAHDAYVCLYNGGKVSIEDFVNGKKAKDIVEKIVINKNIKKTKYEAFRITSTDLPILNMCVTKDSNNNIKIAIGARPAKAKLAKGAMDIINGGGTILKATDAMVAEIAFGTNMRGSGEYRCEIAKVLLEKCLEGVK